MPVKVASNRGVNISRDLKWLLTKDTSCYAIKVRNYPKAFSKDPLNPKGLHLPRFSGSIQAHHIQVKGSAKKKSVTLITKKKGTVRKPATQLCKTTIKRDPRSTLHAIKNSIKSMKRYRRDLKNLTLRRASAIMKSQQDKKIKKKPSKRVSRKGRKGQKLVK